MHKKKEFLVLHSHISFFVLPQNSLILCFYLSKLTETFSMILMLSKLVGMPESTYRYPISKEPESDH